MIVEITEKETQLLMEAGKELRTIGETKIACPRCGKPIVLDDAEFSNVMRCEDKNCIGIVFRH